jgi:hypothetical protein
MVDLPVTVGVEEREVHHPVMLVGAIPVMPVELFLTLEHLSADKAPPVLLSPDLGTKHRRRSQRPLAVTVLTVRRPGRIEGIGVPCDLDVALRFAHLPNADDPFSGGWIGEPPGLPRLMGKVTRCYPAPGFVRVAPFGPPREPPPYKIVELGERLATDNRAVLVRPPAQHGVEGRDELGRSVPRGLLTEGFDPRLECLEAGLAGRHLERARLAMGSLRFAQRLS